MVKDEPIIFQVYNCKDFVYRFKIPYRLDLAAKRPCGRLHVCVDVKVNFEWHYNVFLDDITFDLLPGRTTTILIKPHNDEYFAGWGRWFCWSIKNNELRWSTQREMLTAVLSDPDYAHLESENKIGDNFRKKQYECCYNLEIAPNEDLDGEFEEIGNRFRQEQYYRCNSLKIRPKETIPTMLKKIGYAFRDQQYGYRSNIIINEEQKDDEVFLKMLFENNRRIFLDIPTELKTEIVCKVAVEADGNNIANVPENLKSADLYKIAVKSSRFALKHVPENIKTEEFLIDCGINLTENWRLYEKSDFLSQDDIDALLGAV